MTLVTMKYLTHVSAFDSLDNVQLKCNVDRDFINDIARTINLDLSRYLFDT